MALRRDAYRDEPVLRFQLRERLLSVGDDYWIENSDGQRAFRVDGKALRIRDTWILEDPTGRKVATIKERKLSVRDAIKIEFDGGEAMVKKALVGIRDRFYVDVDGGDDWKIHGNIVDHELRDRAEGDHRRHRVEEVVPCARQLRHRGTSACRCPARARRLGRTRRHDPRLMPAP